jgi:Cu(I)/Ag(I) efflux system membrane protein CusA/SilA
VGPALFFSLLIITLSFIPIFTLEAQEGRLFAPLAVHQDLCNGGVRRPGGDIDTRAHGLPDPRAHSERDRNPLNRWL